MITNQRTFRQAQRGFSLVELLMTTVLVGLMAGALVFSFGNLMRGAHLEEGAGRVEGLVRYARAQAANTGRKVQLVFSDVSASETNGASTSIRMTWEPDPLSQPGQFRDLWQAASQTEGLDELVRIEGVELLAETNLQTISYSEPANDDAKKKDLVSCITFYPDGTCDSAQITLASSDPETLDRMAVRIAGLTGTISHYLISPGEIADPGTPFEQAAPSFTP